MNHMRYVTRVCEKVKVFQFIVSKVSEDGSVNLCFVVVCSGDECVSPL